MPRPIKIITLLVMVAAVSAVLLSAYTQSKANGNQVLGLQACYDYTYTDWSSCKNGQHARQVLTSGPAGCNGGEPHTVEACTICTDFTYSDWSSCDNGKQIRKVISSTPASCSGGIADLSRSCNPGELLNLTELTKSQAPTRLVSSQTDADSLVSDKYRIEGNLGAVYSQPGAETVALFLLINKNTGDIMYLTDGTVKDRLIADGYVVDSTVGYIFAKPESSLLPLYILQSNDGNMIYYVSSESAKNTALTYGFKLITVVGYLEQLP